MRHEDAVIAVICFGRCAVSSKHIIKAQMIACVGRYHGLLLRLLVNKLCYNLNPSDGHVRHAECKSLELNLFRSLD
jgi:hypothetical protein